MLNNEPLVRPILRKRVGNRLFELVEISHPKVVPYLVLKLMLSTSQAARVEMSATQKNKQHCKRIFGRWMEKHLSIWPESVFGK